MSKTLFSGPTSPVVNWPGNKQKLLSQMAPFFPDPYSFGGNFFDVFTGSSAVSLGFKYANTIINDLNPDVVLMNQVIRSQPDELADMLLRMRDKVNKTDFNRLRDIYNDPTSALSPLERVATLLFLSLTCFHGNYRVNRNGAFNQSFGDRNAGVLDKREQIMEISDYLNSSGVRITANDFELCLTDARPGDMVYADPPYDDSKDGYNTTSFGRQGQERLAHTVHELTQYGVSVVVSNYDTPLIRKLFPEGLYQYKTLPVKVGQRCKGENAKDEVLIWNGIKV